MTESEIASLLDAHDGLVVACVGGSIPVDEFLASYGSFPNNYAWDGHEAAQSERDTRRLFGDRIAFHFRVSRLLSGAHAAGDISTSAFSEVASFMPTVVLMRLRELAAHYPQFKAPPLDNVV